MSDKIQNFIINALLIIFGFAYIGGMIIYTLYDSVILLQYAVLIPLIMLISAFVMAEINYKK